MQVPILLNRGLLSIFSSFSTLNNMVMSAYKNLLVACGSFGSKYYKYSFYFTDLIDSIFYILLLDDTILPGSHININSFLNTASFDIEIKSKYDSRVFCCYCNSTLQRTRCYHSHVQY
jgi:hypothetical protein